VHKCAKYLGEKKERNALKNKFSSPLKHQKEQKRRKRGKETGSCRPDESTESALVLELELEKKKFLVNFLSAETSGKTREKNPGRKNFQVANTLPRAYQNGQSEWGLARQSQFLGGGFGKKGSKNGRMDVRAGPKGDKKKD